MSAGYFYIYSLLHISLALFYKTRAMRQTTISGIRILMLFGMLGSASLAAQPHPGLSFKRIFTDYQTLNGGDFGAFLDYRDGWEFGVHYPLNDHLSLNVPIRFGLADKDSDFLGEHFVGADAQVHWHFLANPDRFKPYLLAGAGIVWPGKSSANVQVPVGIGLDVKLTEKAFFTLQSEFRWSSAADNHNFIHGIGFTYFLGPVAPEVPAPVDTDQDGIPDAADECPLVAGPEIFAGCPDSDADQIPDSRDECPDIPGELAFNGCPDTDQDGLPDSRDACPAEAGPVSNNGCPVEVKADADMDGIPDEEDRCPDFPGLLELRGCPDRDGDGIEDAKDACPDKAGPAAYNGCPDTDNDGLEDPKDACPNSPGPIDNKGCPVIEKQDREVLTFAMRAVQFELGLATLKPESYPILNQIAGILKKYPDYRLSIEGHTDNTGSADKNLALSEARAKSCYEYLVGKSIASSRLGYKGFGQTKPVADNSTYSGRTLNRRVEFNLIPPK